jgi:hypothetical protein
MTSGTELEAVSAIRHMLGEEDRISQQRSGHPMRKDFRIQMLDLWIAHMVL